jgi:hypothetical protein
VQTIGLSGLAAGTVSALAAITLVGLTVAQANATVGTQAGALTISPGSGPVTATGITYASSTACPAGHNGSGLVRLIDPGGRGPTNLAAVNPHVTAPFSGTFNTTFATVRSFFPDVYGATSEIVVYCFSGPSATGTAVTVQYTFVTIDAAGHNYTISSGGTTATAPAGGDTIPIDVTVTSATPTATSATPAATSATPAAAPATGGGTGGGSNLALAATGAAVVLAGGGLILLAGRRRRQGAG